MGAHAFTVSAQCGDLRHRLFHVSRGLRRHRVTPKLYVSHYPHIPSMSQTTHPDLEEGNNPGVCYLSLSSRLVPQVHKRV
jgi:hypothetical protein